MFVLHPIDQRTSWGGGGRARAQKGKQIPTLSWRPIRICHVLASRHCVHKASKGARELHKELGKRLREATGGPRAGGFLAQRISRRKAT